MKKLNLILIIFLILPSVNAATIYGSIYDLDFDLIKNSIITIDSVPEQSIISKEGSYSFEVNNGNYIITAKYFVNNILVSETHEKININEEGNFRLDLILFPSDSEEEFLSNIEEDVEDLNGNSKNYWFVLIIFLVLLILFLIFWRPKKKENFEDDEAEKVLEFIKKEGGRTTQKEIRKAFSLSEAKASLIVTELEFKKKIRKIKKGRGNIILLNK